MHKPIPVSAPLQTIRGEKMPAVPYCLHQAACEEVEDEGEPKGCLAQDSTKEEESGEENNESSCHGSPHGF